MQSFEDKYTVEKKTSISSRWVELGLQTEFGDINAYSRIGRMLIGLYEEREIAALWARDVKPYDRENMKEAALDVRLADKKAEITRRIVLNFQSQTRDPGLDKIGALELFDLMHRTDKREKSTLTQLSHFSADELADLSDVMEFAQLYLFTDDWRLRKPGSTIPNS